MEKMTIECSLDRIVIKIASVNKRGSKFIFLFVSFIALLITLLMSLIVISAEGEGGLFIRIFLPLSSLTVCLSFYWPYYWMQKGCEVREVDLARDSFQFYRQVFFKFHWQRGAIASLSRFGFNVKSTEIIQDGSWAEQVMGYQGGQLQFYAGRKKVEFGAALNKEEAQAVITSVSRFLKPEQIHKCQ